MADFKRLTDDLFEKVTVEGFAREIGCSPNSVKQARFSDDAAGKRSPPPGWEAAARKLAERQAAHFTRLAKSLSPRSGG